MQAVFTAHGTVLFLDDHGVLGHGPTTLPPESIARALALVLRTDGGGADRDLSVVEDWDGSRALKRGGCFGCAEPGRADLVFDRGARGAWEIFVVDDLPEAAGPTRRLRAEDFDAFRLGAVSCLDARDARGASPMLRDPSGGAGPPVARIAMTAAGDFETVERQLADARDLLAEDGLIVLEDTDHEAAARAIVASACRRHLRPVVPSGQRASPRVTFLQPWPQAPVARSDKIVLVAVFGDKARAEWEITSSTTRAYAGRIGAELLVIEGDLGPIEGPLAKLHALDRVPDSRRVLMLDTDIVIREAAPDLFEIVPEVAVGLFIESLVCDRRKDLRNTLRCFAVEADGPYYANTGVMMIPAAMVGLFRTSGVRTTLYLDEMYEQNYFNALLHDDAYPVFNISSLFNCMPALSCESYADAHFVHFAGGSVVPQRNDVWSETEAAVPGIVLRSKLHLGGKELRLFDLRNERARSTEGTDEFFQATRILARDALLIRREGRLFHECPPAPDRPLLKGVLGDLPVGRYVLRILLDENAFDEAMLRVAPQGAEPPAPRVDAITAEITSTLGAALCAYGRWEVVDGRVSLPFAIETRQTVTCLVYGADRAFEVYGMHLVGRRADASPPSSGPLTSRVRSRHDAGPAPAIPLSGPAV